MAIDYSKRAKGQSKREYEAQVKGGQLNYKTGKITVPQKVIAPAPKKIVYSPAKGTASAVPQNISSNQSSNRSSSQQSNPFNIKNPFAKFAPQNPFQQQMQSVKNYSSKYDQETEDEKRKRLSAEQDKQIAEDVKKNTGWKNIVKNTVKGLPSAAKKVGSFLGGVGKSVARSPITIPTKTLLTLTNQKEYKPQTKTEKFLVGDEPVTSYTKDQETYSKWAKDKGLSKNKSILAGAGLAMGSIALDLGTGGEGKAVKEFGKGVAKKVGKQILEKGAGKVASTAGKTIFKTAAEGLSSAASRAVNAAIKAGRSKNEIMAIVKSDAKKTFEGIGKNAVQDAEIRAAGNTVIGKKVSTAGRTVANTFKTPRASAAEFAPESGAFRTAARDSEEAAVSMSRGTRAEADRVVKATEKDLSKVIDEAPTPKGKTAIERTKVARLNERAANLRAKVAKAIEDSKRAADDGVTLDKDPFDDIDNEVTSFKREFEALTGEKAPADPDALIARIKGIEGENKGAWLREDRNVTRRKELAALGGVRRGPVYARGMRGGKGIKGRTGAKFAGKKGVFTEARTKQLIKQDNENYKKSLLASISQRQADIRRELEKESMKPKLDLDKMEALRTEMEQDLPLMHKHIRTNKVIDEDLYEMGKELAQKGRDPFKIQFQGERNGILPSAGKPQYNALPLKKDEGAIPQIASAESRGGVKVTESGVGSGGNVPRGTKPDMPEIPPMPKKGPIKQWVDKVGTNVREVIQDNWIRVKKLQEQPNVKVDANKLTPYEAETLFHGRVGHRLTQANDTLKDIDKTIAEAEKSLKRPELRKDIDKYLVAKHAPERNALHGDGAAGMTTQEANDIVKAFEADPNNKGAKEIAQKIKQTNEQTLDILHDTQVISDETYDTLRKTYKEHIPLNRIMEETDDIGGALVGKGYDVKSSGIKRAKGSDKQVDDILTNVGANLEQAIVRAEKNRVNLATLEFARNNKHLGIFEEIKPRAIGTTFGKDGQEGRMIMEQVKDPLVLTVMEKGKPTYLRIKDAKLAEAFKESAMKNCRQF